MGALYWFGGGFVTCAVVVFLLYRYAEHQAFKSFWGP